MTLRQFLAAGNLSAFSSCSKADHPSILLQLGGGLYSKADSDSGDTLVRSPAVDAAPEYKPTPIRPGVWRNKWRIFRAARDIVTGEVIGPGDVVTTRRYPSKELAEAYAKKCQEQSDHPDYPTAYLGPVFFPEEGGAS